MRVTVGGEEYEFTKKQFEDAMRGESAEPIREHVVEMNGTVFPPKQVFATVTGRERQSFTTNEAQRVLTRLGFTCRRAHQGQWIHDTGDHQEEQSIPERLALLEAELKAQSAAIAGFHARLSLLEL
jgi:hypothetical protein